MELIIYKEVKAKYLKCAPATKQWQKQAHLQQQASARIVIGIPSCFFVYMLHLNILHMDDLNMEGGLGWHRQKYCDIADQHDLFLPFLPPERCCCR
jgi:hypothetical protein